MSWTLDEIKKMPHIVEVSRVVESGGDPSELEFVSNNLVVLAPTLAVREGCSNPSVR